MERYGLTSEADAREMSEGALQQEACCANVAVSNTGVADAAPGGGPPAGTQASHGRFAHAREKSRPSAKRKSSTGSVTKCDTQQRVTRLRVLNTTSTASGRAILEERVMSDDPKDWRAWQQQIIDELGVTAQFDVDVERERRIGFLCDYLVSHGLRTLVLGISGGVDSSAAGRLAIERRASTGAQI
jgi:hypothetical protein